MRSGCCWTLLPLCSAAASGSQGAVGKSALPDDCNETARLGLKTCILKTSRSILSHLAGGLLITIPFIHTFPWCIHSCYTSTQPRKNENPTKKCPIFTCTSPSLPWQNLTACAHNPASIPAVPPIYLEVSEDIGWSCMSVGHFLMSQWSGVSGP